MNQPEQRELRMGRRHFGSDVFRPVGGDDWHDAETYQRMSIIGEGGILLDTYGAHFPIETTIERTYLPQDEGNLNELKLQMASLQRDLSKCIAAIDSLSDFVTTTAVQQSTAINSITIDNLDIVLARPLFIILEEYEDESEVTARIPEFQAAGFGATETQAINDLKTLLGELYQDLIDTPDEKLGRLPMQWKSILQKLVAPHV